GHGERMPSGGGNWMAQMSSDYFIEVVCHTAGDLRAAITWLSERPDVRPDAIALGGFSMGAMAALIAGTEDPRPAALISASGSPLPDLANAARFGLHAPGEEASRWALEHDAAAHVARFAPRPLLLQHGRRDDMVPVAGTLRLHDA